MNINLVLTIGFLVVALLIIRKAHIRLRLSLAKHPSLRGHSKWSRRVSKWIPYFEYDDTTFFNCDDAPPEVSNLRRQSLRELDEQFQQTMPKGIELCESLQQGISDVHFTQTYRIPFPFRKQLERQLKTGIAVDRTQGVKVRDIDGNWFYDLTGSYGVNVFGYDFYKEVMQTAWDRVSDLGPVLGPYHPLIKENVEKLKGISRLDEVSFHMSGTEAVMQAVRLARYHTGKSHLVRFCGAYHGWWDGVQPGIGNQRDSNDIYTLSDLSTRTLKVLSTRNDIACVLVNPLQALHPNSDAHSDATLISSDRNAGFDYKAYRHWLAQIRKICSERNIVLIFDEVFTGFRLAYRGAQEFFNIQADMVTYGKTLGGGLPVGVVCGRHDLMKRFHQQQPVNISFARGTFNSHPYVMACMNEFLNRIEQPVFQKQYQHAGKQWKERVSMLNDRLEEEGLPIRVAALMSILTVLYTRPGRYNWMFQFYLRAQGIGLSWVGSGRIIMSHNFNDEDFTEVCNRFIKAANCMQRDGWLWHNPALTNEGIKKRMLVEMLLTRFPAFKRFKRTTTPEHSNSTTLEEAA
jgi:glutamate-1-semialdehyde 2,1-aminomutase